MQGMPGKVSQVSLPAVTSFLLLILSRDRRLLVVGSKSDVI